VEGAIESRVRADSRGALVGRAPEMRQLAAALARVETHSSETLIVDGAPGIGKSRLLAELAGLANGLGWNVIPCSDENAGHQSGGPTTSSGQPYSSLVRGMQRLSAFRRSSAIDALAEIVQSVGDAEGTDRTTLRSAIQGLVATSPTLLLADDAQWLDGASLELLGEFVQARDTSGLLIVCAFRLSTNDSVLAYRHACELESAPTLSLKPLADSAGRELASSVLGRAITDDESELLAHAQGIPVRIREVCADLAARQNASAVGSVPASMTTLVGRKIELVELQSLLANERLITLAGTGGCGKTRLALELTRIVATDFPGGAIWVELAPRTDEPGVIAALAAAAGFGETDTDTFERIRTSLARRSSVLIVLDNAEHVLVSVAPLVARLLTEMSHLRIVCTSREPLDVSGEVVWRVPPLPSPDVATSPMLTVEAIEEFDSVKLFVERASRVRRGFVLSEDNAVAVAQICARLDGLPLAIELVAARVRSMSPDRIAAQLDVRLPRNRLVDRSATARQQTLDASIAWSEELLDDAERTVFRRLAVFVGGFTLVAAQTVVSQGLDATWAVDPYEVSDIITRLVDKSLVVFDDARDRYFLLETIRTFALDRLDTQGELATIRDAHAEWFASWLRNLDDIANAHDAQQFIDRTPGWLQVIAPELANCHSAFEWVPTGGPVSLRLTAGLGYYWLLVAAYDEAVRFGLTAVLAGDPASAEWGEAAMWLLGVIDNSSSDGARVLHDAAVSSGAVLTGRAKVRLDNAMLSTMIGDVGPTEAVLMKFAETRQRAGELKDWLIWTNYTYIPASVCAEFGLLRTAESILGGFENHRTLLASALCHAKRGNFGAAKESIAAAAVFVQRDFPLSLTELIDVAIVKGEVAILTDQTDELLQEISLRVSGSAKGVGAIVGCTSEALWRVACGDLEAAQPLLAMSARCDVPLYAGTAKSWLAPVEMALNQQDGARTTAESLLADWTHVRAPVFEVAAHLVMAECTMTDAPADALASAHLALAAAAEHELWIGAIDSLEMIGTNLLTHGREIVGARLLGAAQAERDRRGYRHRFAHRATYVGFAQEQARSTVGWAEGTALAFEAAIELAQRTRGDRVRPKTGWESLTPTEVQVAQLAMRGLTNPEVATKLFMSRSTVKTHLVHIFAKLGVHNRTELAALHGSTRLEV
jgi:predicted ATPase/DNA-binding CsgD family transcriptional regulator